MTDPPDRLLAERISKADAYLNEKHNLDGQLEWYDNKAVRNKAWHMRLGLIIIVSGAATTIVQLWSPSPEGVHWSTWASALLGAAVIIAKGIDSLWKFDENWSNYRQAAEAMKREKRFFINAVGPYKTCSSEESAFLMFAERIEEILAAESHFFWGEARKETDQSDMGVG